MSSAHLLLHVFSASSPLIRVFSASSPQRLQRVVSCVFGAVSAVIVDQCFSGIPRMIVTWLDINGHGPGDNIDEDSDYQELGLQVHDLQGHMGSLVNESEAPRRPFLRTPARRRA
ncbi:hypothetical protein BDZ89DRAFT_1066251 [Hymenopellis radicata]|nr:hypothetical protein BDZ89DRAFT_1066251 [Hymenopellis radicata]